MTEPRASRLRAGHSSRQVAALLGVSHSTVKAWEGGQNPIPAPMLRLYRLLARLDPLPKRAIMRPSLPPRRGA
jgi:DNA-binding transcriptional regulator YiaG